MLNSQQNIAFLAFSEVLPGHKYLIAQSSIQTLKTEQQLKAKNTKKKENFWSDYRGGKVAPDKAHKLFGALLWVSFCQSFHKEVNDAGKKMNHLRQHTEQLWQVSTGESDTCKYQKKD